MGDTDIEEKPCESVKFYCSLASEGTGQRAILKDGSEGKTGALFSIALLALILRMRSSSSAHQTK